MEEQKDHYQPMNNQTATAFTLGEVNPGLACCLPQTHIHVRDLAISYHNTTILDHVSLDINRGCITALIGPSGCGKTSFLSTLNRLTDMIPGANVSGKISLDEVDILSSSINIMSLRRRIGMIFQKPNPFPLSILRNLELPLREHGLRDRLLIQNKIQLALESVGLWNEVKDRLNKSALLLSGGQQQRLCIARAIVLEPEILLMDEPCSALDPISSSIVEELIHDLSQRFSIVIVTHNLAQAKRIANYVAFFWIKDQIGQLIEFGRCQPLFESPNNPLTAAYISGLKG